MLKDKRWNIQLIRTDMIIEELYSWYAVDFVLDTRSTEGGEKPGHNLKTKYKCKLNTESFN